MPSSSSSVDNSTTSMTCRRRRADPRSRALIQRTTRTRTARFTNTIKTRLLSKLAFFGIVLFFMFASSSSSSSRDDDACYHTIQNNIILLGMLVQAVPATTATTTTTTTATTTTTSATLSSPLRRATQQKNPHRQTKTTTAATKTSTNQTQATTSTFNTQDKQQQRQEQQQRRSTQQQQQQQQQQKKKRVEKRHLTTSMIATTPPNYNCEQLTPNFQVRWKVVPAKPLPPRDVTAVGNSASTTATSLSINKNNTNVRGGSSSSSVPHSHPHLPPPPPATTFTPPSIAFELISRGYDHEEVYMSLGVSGRPDEPYMVGGDVVVADYYQGKPRARDFYMNARERCSSYDNGEPNTALWALAHPNHNLKTADLTSWEAALGVCPDTVETFINDVPTDRISGVRLQHGQMESEDEEEYQQEEENDDYDEEEQEEDWEDEIEEWLHDEVRDDTDRQPGPMTLRNKRNNNTLYKKQPLTSSSSSSRKPNKKDDGFLTLIRYRHPVTPNDVNVIRNGNHDVDRIMCIQPGVMTTIIWALGPLDKESGQPMFHSYGESRDFIQWELGRLPVQDNCEPLVLDNDAMDDEDYHMMEHSHDTTGGWDHDHDGGVFDWHVERIIHPFLRPVLTKTVEFHATLGPPGGERGYPSITGGRTPGTMAWYINDILLPVIEMRRGTTYRFLVNGGDINPSTLPRDHEHPDGVVAYHPFYLTSSISGGYAQLDSSERIKQRILAGIRLVVEQPAPNSPYVVGFEPTALGPLCLYKESNESRAAAAGGYPEYFSSLDTSCNHDDNLTKAAGVLEFTPDSTTPDLIYYQSVTHVNMGWKIHVIDQDAPSIVSVNCNHMWSTPVQLTSELTFHGIVDPMQNTITIELVYRGLAWIAVAFTEGKPTMVGSEAVIGLPPARSKQPSQPTTSTSGGSGKPSVMAPIETDDFLNNATILDTVQAQFNRHNPAKYYMYSNSMAGVVPMPAEKQTLINATIAQTQTLTILRFTKRLFEPGENPIYSDRPNLFLFAHGSNNDLSSFHTSFGAFELLPNQCGVYVNGELQNEHALYQQLGDDDWNKKVSYRGLWIAHGLCAVLAWGILVPLAVGASIIRNVLVKVLGLPEDSWFWIHRALNLTAGFLTLVSFALAVRAMNLSTLDGEDAGHFNNGITHRRMGLVIFVLTLIQVSSGLGRPRLAPGASRNRNSSNGRGGGGSSQSSSRNRNRPHQPPILPPRLSRHGISPEDADDETIRRIAECARYLGEETTFNTTNSSTTYEGAGSPGSGFGGGAAAMIDRRINPDHQVPDSLGLDKSGIENERYVWEISHRLYGFVLLGLTWWQIHDGLGIFALRFECEYNLEQYFWFMVSCIAGSIGVIAIFARGWCS